MTLWFLEGARMDSHKTCHFPIISLKHVRSISPCGPWIPPVLREKGTGVRALGCCWQYTVFSRHGAVGSGRALQSPIRCPFGTRAATCVSRSVVSPGWCLSEQSCKAAVLQDINVLKGLGREDYRSRGIWTLIWALCLWTGLQILTSSSAGSQTI